MLEFIGGVVVIGIIAMLISIITADEAEVMFALNDKTIIHYTKGGEDDGKEESQK